MSLCIQPLFGDPFSIPLSPETHSWRDIYYYLKNVHYRENKVEQICLFHNGQTDLSEVKDGDLLHILINEPMVERWVSEYTTDNQWEKYGVRFHHSTLTWYDGRWGDPYENPSVQYRTSLTIHILLRETLKNEKIVQEFTINPVYFKELYGRPNQQTETWYPTLYEACHSFRKEWNEKQKEDSFTERTADHLIRLWELYHGSNQHLIDQGRYYDY